MRHPVLRDEHVFKALADPSRRRIIKLLQKGSLSAGEIGKKFDFTAASLSHHLAALRAADLVRAERRGQSIVYSLNTSVVEDVAAYVMDLLGMRSRGIR